MLTITKEGDQINLKKMFKTPHLKKKKGREDDPLFHSDGFYRTKLLVIK